MRKLNVTILIGVLAALVGFVLVFGYGRNVDKRVADGKATTTVLVANEALAAGATPADLARKLVATKVPKAYVADGALTDLDAVKGKVLLGPVAKGGQLTRSQFGQPAAAGSVRPGKGRVALAVGVSLTPGVARYITAGSSVDVFVTYTQAAAAQPTGSGTDSQATIAGLTKLFASNVKVLSVTVAAPVDDANKKNGGSLGTSSQTSTGEVVAVLDVTPADAEKLVNAATLGKLYLALSSLDGTGTTAHRTTGVTPKDVVDSNR